MLLFDLADISDHLAKLVDFNNKEGIVLLHVANNKKIFIIGTCEDDAKVAGSCPVWAGHGECSENPAFMLAKCRKSCDPCGGKIFVSHTNIPAFLKFYFFIAKISKKG